MNEPRPLRIGVIGFGWMGRLHARAWARLASHYPDLPLRPVLVAVGDNGGGETLERSVRAHGFAALQASDGFQWSGDPGETFGWMIRFIDHGLRAIPAPAGC